MKTLRVAILVYDACFGAELFGVADVLRMANHVATHSGRTAARPFDVRVVGASRTVALAGGMRVSPTRLRGPIDLLVVPGFDFEDPSTLDRRLEGLRAEVAAIRRTFERGVPVASTCVGAFLLGASGLLHRRRATTAWAFAPLLAERHPTARITPDALLVTDGGVTTCAAFSAALDLGMHLVRQHATPSVAARTSKLTLIAGARDSQTPYVDQSLLRPVVAPFSAEVRAYLADRLREPYDLPRLAKVFHVSTRTLLRRFRIETQRSPLSFLQDERIAHAKTLLETTALSVGNVMEACGYQDLSTFRKLFAARVGMSPGRYRLGFRTQTRASSSRSERCRRDIGSHDDVEE